MSSSVFRFAPSPNGYLHLGHACSALLNFDLARECGGRFLLRIEDIDPARCRPEFEQAIYEDLAWLGIVWEEPVRRQSEHLASYREALEALQGMGLIYPSFLSRSEIARRIAGAEGAGQPWPRDPDGAPLYPGHAGELAQDECERRISAGENFALRLDMRAAISRAGALSWDETGEGPRGEHGIVAADPVAWGDIVLARKETPTSYHLSVVVDDAVQGITDVVRGQDLFAATAVHRVLHALLGIAPPRYRHHRLIRGSDGRKLSKADGATGLRTLRAAGVSLREVRERIGLD